MDGPSTMVKSATCSLKEAMTGIQVAKPMKLKAIVRAVLGVWLNARIRDQIEAMALREG